MAWCRDVVHGIQSTGIPWNASPSAGPPVSLPIAPCMARASERIARLVKHFLDVLDELSWLNVEYVSFRENIDIGGPLGRAIIIIVGAVAELERNLIVERVRAGMRRPSGRSAHRPSAAGTR